MVLNQVIATDNPTIFQKLFRRYNDYPFSETELRRDQIRLERYYHRRGYHNVDVSFEVEERSETWKRDVTFHIVEGTPIRITSSEITIDADEQTREELWEMRDFNRAAERHEYREGERYQTVRMPDVEGRFLQALENAGYAWPDVEITANVDSSAGSADVEIYVKPNTKTFFSDFIIDGELSVPERVLIRQSDIQRGDVYSRNQIQNAQRSIFNHHLFRFASITIPEQEKDSTLTVMMRVREYPPRTVEAAFGVGREEIVRGLVTWQHRNINGGGHRFGSYLRASFIEQRAGVDYLIPYVFNARSSNVSSLFGMHRIEPAYELLQAGFNNNLVYQIERHQTASLSYEFSFNEELSRERGVQLPDTVLNYNVSSFIFTGYYSEGFAREQRGWVIQPSAEFSGVFGETDFSFQKLNLDVRRFTHVFGALTIAKRINAGALFYRQSRTLPSHLRFFTGGTNSVRGWGRQDLGPSRPSFDSEGNFSHYVPVGGRAMFTFNIELRQQIQRIIPNFGLAGFLDGGQVWEDIHSIGGRPIQFGAGGGLRYQSPIGPVRVDIAYKLNPTDEDLNIFNGQGRSSPWDRIGIHFSIGQAF